MPNVRTILCAFLAVVGAVAGQENPVGCAPSPCLNSGTCTTDCAGDFDRCVCPNTHTGVMCETPIEWIENAGRYYYISTSKCTYSECRAICKSMGADLITIDSAEEQTFAHNNVPSGEYFFWLSIYKSTPGILPGTWVAKEDCDKSLTYTNWDSNYPRYPDWRCAYATSGFYFRWADIDCTWQRYYICEK